MRPVCSPASLFALALTALAARELGAQRPASRPPLVLDGREASLLPGVALGPRDGGLRADGPHYTATFAPEGVVFTPARSASGPHPGDVRLRTLAVGRGDAVPPVAAADAAPTQQPGAELRGPTACFARGAGLTETWQVRPEGIELAYVFASPIAGHGDLRVHLALTTGLEPVADAAGGAADAAIHLRPPAATGALRGGVRIGGVTGIDAIGRRQCGSLSLRDGILELRLPASFVDTAVYPLVLDPLVGTDFAVNPIQDQSAPAVAYDAASQRYLVVWEQEVNLTNVQIVGRFVDASGTPVGSAVTIHYSAGHPAHEPVVANVRGSGRFLVAWRQSDTVFGPWEIACRCVHPDGTLSATLDTAITTGSDAAGPLLGGNAGATDTTALLAYVVDSDLLAQRITVPAGTGAPSLAGGAIAVETSALSLQHVTMAPSNGPTARWALCWTRSEFGPPYSTRCVRLVNTSGSFVGAQLSQPGAGGYTDVIDGDGSRYLVAWSTSTGVTGQRLLWNGAALVLDGAATELVANGHGKVDLRVNHLGPRILLTWSDDGGVPLQNDIAGVALDPATCRPCDVPFTIVRPASYDFAPAVAAQWAANPAAGNACLIVFGAATLAPPFDGTIVAQRFAAIGPGGPLTDLGGGCGRPLTMTASGAIALGNAGLLFQLDGVSGATAVLFAIGVPGAPTVPCGTCQITVPVLLPLVRFGGNRAVLPLPIGCDMALLGSQLELQGWVLGTLESPCAVVPGLSFSNRHLATLGL